MFSLKCICQKPSLLTLNENFAKLDRTNKETYILGDNGTIMVNILYVKITPKFRD